VHHTKPPLLCLPIWCISSFRRWSFSILLLWPFFIVISFSVCFNSLIAPPSAASSIAKVDSDIIGSAATVSNEAVSPTITAAQNEDALQHEHESDVHFKDNGCKQLLAWS